MMHHVHVKFHSEALLEELEARQLFSGGIEGILADNNEAETAVHMELSAEPELIDSLNSIAISVAEIISQELVFIDIDVTNYQQLLNDIIGQSDEDRNIEVILLDNQRDGIEQMSEALASFQNLDAVHLISHGSGGSVDIGNSRLDSESVNNNLVAISDWANAFSENGDFLIYGCNLAENEEGQSLVNALSALTQTDVAASEDLTGNVKLGGDWDLEYVSGTIEADIAVSQSGQQEWLGVLNVAPTDLLTSGALNLDGSWGGITVPSLELDNRTDFTVEMEIRPAQISSNGWSYSLVHQYLDGSDVDTQGWDENGFYLDINAGQFDYSEYDSFVYQGGAEGSGSELKVGTWQTVTLTRDINNDIAVYLDGVQVATGSTNQQIVDSAGVLTFLDGFDGDVRDIRVFDRALTSLEVNTSLNANLLLHYDFASGTGTAILDRNTPATNNNGTLDNPGVTNWITINEIPENSALDTVVGFLSADDPDAGDSITYSILNDPSNNFKIVGREIRVNAIATLNYDSASTHVITVRVTDSGTPGLTYDEDITIQLNKAPTTGNAGSGSPEDSASITINLNGSDVDGTVTHFKLDNLPANGNLYLDGGLTALVNANQDYARIGALLPMYFVPDANWTGTTSFTYLAKDNSGQYSRSAGTATINVTPVNDAPIATGGGVTGTEDTAYVMSWSDFNVSDVDTLITSQTAVRIDSLPVSGTLQFYNGSTWIAVSSGQLLTKATVVAGSVRFVPLADEAGADSYSNSGLGNGFNDYAQFGYTPIHSTSLNINNANAESLIVPEGNEVFVNTGTTQWFYPVTGNGGGIYNPPTSVFPTDSDNALFTVGNQIIFQTLNSTFSSSNDYSLSLDIGWANFNTSAPTFRIELWAGGAQLGFIDNSHVTLVKGEFVSGTLSIDGSAFSALDGQSIEIRLIATNSSPENYFDNLVLTEFDRTYDVGDAGSVMNIDITPVNDAPVAIANTVTTNEDTAYTFSVGDFTYTDVDSDALATVTIRNLNLAGGTLILSGLTTVTDGMIVFRAGIPLLVYTPANNASGAPLATFDFTVNDAGQGIVSAQMDINVSTQNDAPILSGGSFTLTTITEDNTNNNGNTVGEIIASAGGTITDIDDNSKRGIAVTGTALVNGGIATWQYSTNNGSNWNDIGSVSWTNALLLREGDRIRALPNSTDGTDPAGLPSISFRAWDITNGVNLEGSKVDTNSNGGTTAFSTAIGTAHITVTDINDAPVNSAPTTTSTNEDTELIFSSANNNLISITDVDAGNTLRITLTSTNGLVTLTPTAGLTFTVGDGIADTNMTFEGSLADINAALDGLSFIGDQDFNGVANIQIITDDLTLITLNEDTSQKGYYTFNNTGDLGNDDSVGGVNDATVNGAITTNDATRGDVLRFNGNDDVQIAGLFGSPTEVTLAAWVNLDLGPFDNYVISLGDSVGIIADEGGGGVNGYFYDGSTWQRTQSNQSISGTGWHHVAYTFSDSGNVQTLYIDGIEVVSTNFTTSPSYSLGTDSYIGRHGNAVSGYFNGKIDETRIYNRALTASEIQTLVDEQLSTDTNNIVITVNAVNDAPELVITSTFKAYTENSAPIIIDSTLTLTDIDSSTLSGATIEITNFVSDQDILSVTDSLGITGSWDAVNGILTLSGNTTVTNYQIVLRSVTYQNTSEDPNTTPRLIELKVTDDDNAVSSPVIRSISVNSVYDRPETNDVSASGVEDASSIAIILTATDVDSTIQEYQLNSLPGNGTLYTDASLATLATIDTFYAAAGEQLTLYFVPNNNWNGDTTFQFTAKDVGLVDLTPATATITVTSVNDAPILDLNAGGGTYYEADPEFATFIDNNAIITDEDLSDYDGGQITTTIITNGTTNDRLLVKHEGTGGGEVEVSGSNIYINGVLVASISGGIGNSDPLVITFNNNSNVTITQQIARRIAFNNVSDAPSENLRTIQMLVTDGDGGISNTDTRGISVVNVNDTPTVDQAMADQSATEDIPFSFQFATNVFTDVDAGDSLTYTSNATGWLNFDSATRTFSGTPLNADVGTTSVTVTANDGNGGTVSDTFDIVISNTNDAPTVANAIADRVATEDAAFSFQFAANTFNDSDIGDTLTYTSDAAGWLSFDAATRTFSGTPLNADVGTTTVTVTASDGNGGTVTEGFDIVTGNTSDAATIAGVDTGIMQEDVSVLNNNISTSGLLTISDDDVGEAIFVAETFTGSYGELVMQSDGNWTYTANNAQTSIQRLGLGESITETITVSSADNTTHNVVITINGTDDISVIAGTVTGSVTEDGALSSSGSLTLSDIDSSDSAQFADVIAQVGDHGYGTFSIIANTWAFTLDNNHAAVQALDSGEVLTDTYTFVAPDGVTQQVTVTINGAEDIPVFNLTAVTTATEGDAYRQIITVSDVDIEAVSITADSLPAWLNLIDNGDGSAILTGTPGNAEAGGHSVVLSVSDGSVSSSWSFTVSVASSHDEALLFSHFLEEPGFSSTAMINESRVAKNAVSAVLNLSAIDTRQEGEVEVLQSKKIHSISLLFKDANGANNIEEDEGVEDRIKLLDDSSYLKVENNVEKWNKSQLLILNEIDLQLDRDDDLFELSEMKANQDLWNNIDLMREQMNADTKQLEKQDFEIEFVAVTTIGITAGFVNWVLRGGALLSSLLSSVSLFKQFDPLAVVFTQNKTFEKTVKTGGADDSDVEKLFDKNNEI